jgi:hypothetical protein
MRHPRATRSKLPLVVDPDAVLTLAISREGLQPIAGQRCQVGTRLRRRDPVQPLNRLPADGSNRRDGPPWWSARVSLLAEVRITGKVYRLHRVTSTITLSLPKAAGWLLARYNRKPK